MREIAKSEIAKPSPTETTVFEIKECHAEIKKKGAELYEGCTVKESDLNPVVLERWKTKEEALDSLKKNYKTRVELIRGNAYSYYLVTEYYVEENVYDEDNEWVSGGDVWDFTKMPKIRN